MNGTTMHTPDPLADDLDAQLDDEFAPDGPVVRDPDRWTIADDDTAEWAARKLARAERAAADVDALADRYIERINAWRTQQLARVEADRAFFAGALTGYMRRLAVDDPKLKTHRLPSATLKARKQPDGVDIGDRDGFAAWALEHGRDDLVRVKTSPDMTAVKRAVLRDGEALPGVEPRPGDVTFTVTVDDDGSDA